MPEESQTDWTTVISCAVVFALIGAGMVFVTVRDAPPMGVHPIVAATVAFGIFSLLLVGLQVAGLVYYDMSKKTLVVSPWFGWLMFGTFVCFMFGVVLTGASPDNRDISPRNGALAASGWVLVVVAAYFGRKWILSCRSR